VSEEVARKAAIAPEPIAPAPQQNGLSAPRGESRAGNDGLPTSRERLIQRMASTEAAGGSGGGKPMTMRQRLVQRFAQRSTEPASEERRDANGVGEGADAAVERASLSSGGTALPRPLRKRFESSLGTDLGDVRVHTGAASNEAARSLGALAYTTGRNIHFREGHYQPGSQEGDRLLAHEVAHTVQQSASPAMKSEFGVTRPGDSSETEADRAAGAMTSGATAQLSPVGGGAPIAREKDDKDKKPPPPPQQQQGAGGGGGEKKGETPPDTAKKTATAQATNVPVPAELKAAAKDAAPNKQGPVAPPVKGDAKADPKATPKAGAGDVKGTAGTAKAEPAEAPAPEPLVMGQAGSQVSPIYIRPKTNQPDQRANQPNDAIFNFYLQATVNRYMWKKGIFNLIGEPTFQAGFVLDRSKLVHIVPQLAFNAFKFHFEKVGGSNWDVDFSAAPIFSKDIGIGAAQSGGYTFGGQAVAQGTYKDHWVFSIGGQGVLDKDKNFAASINASAGYQFDVMDLFTKKKKN
jgi:hypothetical protein